MHDLLTRAEYAAIAAGLDSPATSFIDGESQIGSAAMMQTWNRATGDVITTVSSAGADDRTRAVSKAREVCDQGVWARRHPSTRKAVRQACDTAMPPVLRTGLPLTEEDIARIDAVSMAILQDVGVVYRDPIALADWKRAGADVRGETVYLDRTLVCRLIAAIPESFTYHALNQEFCRGP